MTPSAPAPWSWSPWIWAAALALAAGVFIAAPGLDLATSRLAFDGAGFPVARIAWVEAIRMALYWAEDIAGLAAFPLAFWAARRGAVMGQGARVWLFQGLVFLAGPALLVNGILKPLWGRPRPYHILDFGGDQAFQPIWQTLGPCTRSCSFTSGEMAGATALTLMALMLLAANRDRLTPVLHRAGLALAIFPMPFTAVQRIAAGKHFLSDVVCSALAVGLLASLLARLIWPPRR